MILKISKKAHINSYEFSDIENECYTTLFKCINKYNLSKHRFVAYATIAIKNSLINLIRASIRKSVTGVSDAIILYTNLNTTSYLELENIEDIIITKTDNNKLRVAIKILDSTEKELLEFVYFKGYSLKKYSEVREITYCAALTRKNHVLAKLRASLALDNNQTYNN